MFKRPEQGVGEAKGQRRGARVGVTAKHELQYMLMRTFDSEGHTANK